MSFESQINAVERDIRQLRIEFDKFMAGATRVPPEEFRFQIGRRIRRMRESKLRSFAERFRLGSVEASFNTLCELHGRRLRDVESGKKPGPGRPEASGRPDAGSGFVLGGDPDQRAVEALYRELYGASGRAAKADFGSFEKLIGKQVSKLQKKTGCKQVHLRVAREGDTLKLKAKPVREEPSS